MKNNNGDNSNIMKLGLKPQLELEWNKVIIIIMIIIIIEIKR